MNTSKKIVAISGASGLVGKPLTETFASAGWRVLRLVRRPAQTADEVQFDIENGRVDADKLEGLEAVVHLAGENISSGRWTAKRKATILHSRVAGTRLLSETLAKLSAPPPVLVSGSAIGFYGDQGEQTLTEQSPNGSGFLAEVCREWEAATASAAARVRVVHLRTGVVLAKEGGALAKMLTPFRLCLGGKIGSGRQFWSWIALPDLLRVIRFACDNSTIAGALNAVSPQPVTNLEFTKSLGLALNRPTLIPMPAPLARLLLGEMADELLLASQKVVPQKLQQAQFRFDYPDLRGALSTILLRLP
ncbi:MAG TPA: TIGR01777 family oxidoreductase [Pirellulales bacterium]|nr:TIGR01777 family oxidoreductase [Pirellulales bacterium]